MILCAFMKASYEVLKCVRKTFKSSVSKYTFKLQRLTLDGVFYYEFYSWQEI